jgi:hypothetical protein
MHVNRWVLMLLINVFLLVCGFFIPPAAIILMTAPILLPIMGLPCNCVRGQGTLTEEIRAHDMRLEGHNPMTGADLLMKMAGTLEFAADRQGLIDSVSGLKGATGEDAEVGA